MESPSQAVPRLFGLPRRSRLAERAAVVTPKRQQTVLAVVVYLGLACFITWPIPIHPGSTLYGPIGADLTGGIAYYHGLAHLSTPPFLPGIVHAFNAPEGRSTQWALNFSTLPSSTLLWLGSVAVGPIATFAYWSIISFAGSALAMFLFVRWLTGSWHAGLIAGLAFGFWPFVYVARDQPLGDLWVVVLFAWRMLVAIERPTVRNGMIAGAAAVLALMWVQYYLLIVGVSLVVLVACALVVGWARDELRTSIRVQGALVTPVVLALAAILAVGVAGHFSGAPTRPASDLVKYSARPLMYVLPDPANPFFGSITKPIITRCYFEPTSSSTYDDIYLGISMLMLATAGAFMLVRHTRRVGLKESLAHRRSTGTILFLITAIVAVLFSGPPHVTIAGVSVPMPMAVVGSFTTTFRTISHFSFMVMFGVCVLAGFALSGLLPRLRRNSALIVVAVLAVVVTCDLWAANTVITHVRVPKIYRILAKQPPGIYAEYPLQTGMDFADASKPAFYQAWAGEHDIFNGYFPGTDSETSKLGLMYLTASETIPELAESGVRYLLVDNLSRGSAPPMYPAHDAPLGGARLIASDSYAALYRIVAHAPPISTFALSSFSDPEGAGPGFTRWMTSSQGQLELRSTSAHPARARVSLVVVSFARPRRLRVTDDLGHVLYDATIPYAYTRIRFDVVIRRRTLLTLSATPGPESPHQLDPKNPDTRQLSIQISQPLSVQRLDR
jgi:hypothetical protein